MNIYIIAGPPGVGKSTSGYRFVPADVSIIDQDLSGIPLSQRWIC